RAMEIARRRRDAEAGAYAHSMASILSELLGDADSALRQARQAVEMGEASGSPGLRGMGLGRLARAPEGARQRGGASGGAGSALATVRPRRVGLLIEGDYLAVLAHAHLRSGAPPRALEAAQEAIARARAMGNRVHEIRALLARAHVLTATEGAPARDWVE